MARGFIRKPSFNKIIGAYRSQWKRMLMRLFTFGAYGKKGMGWWRNPRKAFYNYIYHRTSISVYDLLGYKPSRLGCFIALAVTSFITLFTFPVDIISAGVKAKSASSCGNKKGKNKGNKSASGNTTNNATQKRRAQKPNVTKQPTVNKTVTKSSVICKPTSSPSKAPSTSRKPSTAKTVYIPNKTEKAKGNYNEEMAKIIVKNNADFSSFLKPHEPEKIIDKNAPKSKPKREGDQYIRKRMNIAGLYYGDASAVDKLKVGDYLEFVAEPNNPHDRNAVAIYSDGAKIGYVARTDASPIATALRLGRGLYGVATHIAEREGKKIVEYEAWMTLHI